VQLETLGWTPALQQELEQLRHERGQPELAPARVATEHPGSYQVFTEAGPEDASLGGRLRHIAQGRLDLPAVGDWVALGAGHRVEAVLTRKSCFVRKAAHKSSEPQVIATNIDRVFVVTSANSDFNPRRIERYLSAVWESGATPVLVLNKIDLCEDRERLLDSLGAARVGLPVACVSARDRYGAEELGSHIPPAGTIALVGSSGVGKSTLTNWLLGYEALATQAVLERDERGQHTTTHRQLLPLPAGGALIDTPGMREFGLWNADVDATFHDVQALAGRCRFADCAHEGEPGCAIATALASGELEAERLESYFKLERENRYVEARHSHSLRQAQKRFSKLINRANRQRAKHPLGKG
jgi:ribosome biogenesis GTPase / thiamine phosphate phosphatase